MSETEKRGTVLEVRKPQQGEYLWTQEELAEYAIIIVPGPFISSTRDEHEEFAEAWKQIFGDRKVMLVDRGPVEDHVQRILGQVTCAPNPLEPQKLSHEPLCIQCVHCDEWVDREHMNEECEQRRRNETEPAEGTSAHAIGELQARVAQLEEQVKALWPV